MARIPRSLRTRTAPDPSGPAPSASDSPRPESDSSSLASRARRPESGSSAHQTLGSGGRAATAADNAAADAAEAAGRVQGRRPSAAALNAAKVKQVPEGTAEAGLQASGQIPEGHVLVARIGRAHGIRGQVTVEVHTDAPEIRLADGATLTASGVPGRPTVTVAGTHWHSGRLLLEVAGVADRTGAEGLRGLLLSVPGGAADEVEAGDEDDFWDHQLVGLRALDAAGEQQGTVVDVLHLPGGDTLVLEHAGTERLLPFLKAFVPSVDLAAGTLVVAPPEGLWE